jgi:hypothetical protein
VDQDGGQPCLTRPQAAAIVAGHPLGRAGNEPRLERDEVCRRPISLSFGPAAAYHRKIRRRLHLVRRISPATAAETREVLAIPLEKASKS